MHGVSVADKRGTRILLLLVSTTSPVGMDKVPRSLWKRHPSCQHEMFLWDSREAPGFCCLTGSTWKRCDFCFRALYSLALRNQTPFGNCCIWKIWANYPQVAVSRTEIYVCFGKRGYSLLSLIKKQEVRRERRDWLNRKHWRDFLWGTLAEVLRSWRKLGWFWLKTVVKIDFGHIFQSFLIHPWQYLLKQFWTASMSRDHLCEWALQTWALNFPSQSCVQLIQQSSSHHVNLFCHGCVTWPSMSP